VLGEHVVQARRVEDAIGPAIEIGDGRGTKALLDRSRQVAEPAPQLAQPNLRQRFVSRASIASTSQRGSALRNRPAAFLGSE
jgi:hypothetical protein